MIASTASRTESLAFHRPPARNNNLRRTPSATTGHHHNANDINGRRQRQSVVTMTTASTVEASAEQRDGGKSSSSSPSASGECYYRRIDGHWRPRKDLRRLSIGERLFATRLAASDLLDGKTGPKVFLDCGAGIINTKGKWSIANGMVRIGRRGMKKSVVRKKLQKIPPNTLIEVYVSKIRVEEGTLEVCLRREDALKSIGSIHNDRIPASSLEEGTELTGTVRQVTPYGVFVDVNANRNGLVHISKVAQRQDKYVNKEEGLKKLGLNTGSSVNVVVLSNRRKRLELDLAPEREEDAGKVSAEVGSDDDRIEDEAAAWAAYGADEGSDGGGDVADDDEAAMWAAYASGESSSGSEGQSEGSGIGDDDEARMWAAYAADSSGDVDANEEDDNDEDAAIEDAFGIGYY
eukprot:CAMPEP_0181106618 /NCGR_PEP_ID=MMETSP1071-20121207/16627_1 /TAXON_ID=35127 /ORGANISM="Thalassiosira sp., Strain NH16" /LENGTH=405 /DNA_ID=CAMNT_0023190035 /DNA_START=27 /DNA_END=1244 /DNA_ORIENTATION=+